MTMAVTFLVLKNSSHSSPPPPRRYQACCNLVLKPKGRVEPKAYVGSLPTSQ